MSFFRLCVPLVDAGALRNPICRYCHDEKTANFKPTPSQEQQQGFPGFPFPYTSLSHHRTGRYRNDRMTIDPDFPMLVCSLSQPERLFTFGTDPHGTECFPFFRFSLPTTSNSCFFKHSPISHSLASHSLVVCLRTNSFVFQFPLSVHLIVKLLDFLFYNQI